MYEVAYVIHVTLPKGIVWVVLKVLFQLRVKN